MFKIKSRKQSTPQKHSAPPLGLHQIQSLDFYFLTTPTNIVESFSEDLLSQFESKRATIVGGPIPHQQPIEEPLAGDDEAPSVPPKVPVKSTDLHLLALDDAFQIFINGGDTPVLSEASHALSVTSENVANGTGQSVTTDGKDSEAESSNLLRKSSSYLRSKFKLLKSTKSLDNLKKPQSIDDIIPDVPSPPVELMKGKFSLDAARSFKPSAFPQNKKNNQGRVSAQEALASAVPSPLSLDESIRNKNKLTTVPLKISSAMSQNTAISLPQYTNGSPQLSASVSQCSASAAHAHIFANYPPQPLKYTPVEKNNDAELMVNYQGLKRHTSSKRISLPAVLMRHRSASQAVTIDNSALDITEITKADRRKSDPNMLPISGTFGRRARLFQTFVSGGGDKRCRKSFLDSRLSEK